MDQSSSYQAQMLGQAQGINQNLAELVKTWGSTSENLSQNGYVQFSNKLIINWGYSSTSSGTGLIIYNKPFPNSCINVILTITGSSIGSDYALIASTSPGNTSCNVYSSSGSTLGFNYIAIGY